MMLNRLARLVLVATSLSPMLGAIAVSKYANSSGWQEWTPWVAVALILFALCSTLLWLIASSGERVPLTPSKVERNDKEVLGFLLAYLLPVVSAKESAFQVHWETGAYVFLILVLVFTHANALHFNPLLGMLGFHFYSVEDASGGTLLLITRKPYVSRGEALTVVMISSSIALYVKESKK